MCPFLENSRQSESPSPWLKAFERSGRDALPVAPRMKNAKMTAKGNNLVDRRCLFAAAVGVVMGDAISRLYSGAKQKSCWKDRAQQYTSITAHVVLMAKSGKKGKSNLPQKIG